MALAAGELGPAQSILGHEGVGRAVKIGEAVPPSIVELGDRIGIAWLRDVCGVCQCCLHPGGETRCLEELNSGRKIDGTFSEYAIVPSRYILRIPNTASISDEDLAPIMCGGLTAYAALKGSGLIGGQFVAISGAGGGVGALAVQYAKAMGYRVVAIDVGVTKQKLCLDSGADHYIDASGSKSLEHVVREITKGQGVSAVLVCAASGAAYNAAIGILAPFGTVIAVGIPPSHQLMTFHPLQLIAKGFKIMGSAVGTKQDLLEAIEFVERGLVKPAVIKKDFSYLEDVASDFSKVRPLSSLLVPG
jgi:propanol-preferring alcohol dehydrogenase